MSYNSPTSTMPLGNGVFLNVTNVPLFRFPSWKMATESERLLRSQLRKLRELERLQSGWDGYGAFPVDYRVAGNTEKALKKMTSAQLKNWGIRPNNNGTLLLVPKCIPTEYATICIGADGITYAAIFSDGTRLKGTEDYSLGNFKKIIDLIDGKLEF